MKSDIYENQKLDAFEQSIENSIGTDKWKPASKKSIEMLQKAARNTIALREKKEARVNLSNDN